MTTYNFKHYPLKCPLCKTNTHVLKDDFHGEIFCNKCGLVIQDSTHVQITQIINQTNYKDKYFRALWRKRV